MFVPILAVIGTFSTLVLGNLSSEILSDEDAADDSVFLSSAEEIDQFRQLLNPFLRERVSGTEGNLLVQEHIRQVLSNLGWHVIDDRFFDDTPIGQKQFTNIVATLDPNSSSRLTLACHFDSKKFDNFVFIGATDSAVPCALLLDIAWSLNASLWQSTNAGATTTLQLIFFDGEEAFVEWSTEDSLYGSRHLAEQMDNWQIVTDDLRTIPAIKAISVLVLLDLIGAPDCTFINWFPKTSHLYSQLQSIEKRLFLAGLMDPVGGSTRNLISNQFFPDKHIPKMMRSGIEDDHVPFMRRNVSVLHLIPYPFPKFWHKASDNEEALSYPAINNFARILRVFVAEYLQLH